MNFEIDGKIHTLVAELQPMPGFCGAEVFCHFYHKSHDIKHFYNYDQKLVVKAKSLKNAVLELVKQKCQSMSCSKLVMHDAANGPLHRIVMKNLPKKFTLEAEHGWDPLPARECTVTVGKPYFNFNHNHKTIECEILIQKAKKKPNARKKGRVSPA